MAPALFVQTPLWHSRPLSKLLDSQVFLKMEAFQPAGSFKSRGMGAACLGARQGGARQVICASGGNAGLAVANAGRRLGLQVTIVVPETTSQRARDLIAAEGADLVVSGTSWAQAHQYASEELVGEGRVYIHPFDDPVVWEGHASMVPEIVESGLRPGAIVVSVGGGGLLSGLLSGMHRAGWTDIPVLAAETEGAASFAAAVAAGHLVTLPEISSLAVTLGASSVCQQALDWAGRHPILPFVVSDRQAVEACLRFADDHRVLVEPACGAALAAGYGRAVELAGRDPIVFIVCGGAGVSRDLLATWSAQVS